MPCQFCPLRRLSAVLVLPDFADNPEFTISFLIATVESSVTDDLVKTQYCNLNHYLEEK